ncbi:hypothetical protein [Methanococcoides sp. FTZ1]|uniref:hypothetical protein n=1 Tax=Methanococcoides sp. FTZ1 TaxID=3439061 RepID=UPI003F835FB1
MGSENRDFVIERLERKLAEKEEEIEIISSKLHDSIVKELRKEMKSDLDINNRLVKIEQKVQEISSNLSGIMEELLDQKSQLRSLSRPAPKTEQNPFETISIQNPFNSPAQKTEEIPVTTNKGNLADTLFGQKKAEPAARPLMGFTDSPLPEMKEPIRETTSTPQWSKLVDPKEVNMEIRDISHPEPIQETARNIATEYIVAEGGDVPANSNYPTPRGDECEYIIAEEGSPSRTLSESEYETVEDRNDEDTVITTTRRKSF